MARRNLGKYPTQDPLVDDMNRPGDPWQHWFGLIAEHVFKVDKYTVVINPTSVSANTTSEQTFTVNGVASNDMVLVSKPSHTTGLGIVNARVSAKDTVALTFMNNTGSPIDPPSETYTILVLKV